MPQQPGDNVGPPDDAAGPPSVQPTSPVRYYFVDESGDGTIFDAKGRVIVGKGGCSRFFMLGKLEVAEPDRVAKALTALREKLLADPYFAGVPSMQSGKNKTAVQSHAKDDLP